LTHETDPAEPARAEGLDYAAFDALATLVAVVEPDGRCLFANSELEAVAGPGQRGSAESRLTPWPPPALRPGRARGGRPSAPGPSRRTARGATP